MIKLKFLIFIFLVGIVHANGLSINSCFPGKQDDLECTTTVGVPGDGKKGLKCGPKFTLKGMVFDIV